MLLKANRPIPLYLLMWTIMVTCSARGVSNRLVGLKYISYTNFDGTIANGRCCDEPGKLAGSCTPNLCDTAFEPCGTNDENHRCNVYRDQRTPTTYNSSFIKFGRVMGNHENKTASFLVLKFPYDKNNINFTIKVYEMPDSDGTSRQDIAEFKFTIDWVDNKFNPPDFHRFVLNDTRAQLVLDVVSQCSRHYFTDDCSVYCRPDKIHYTCMDNGTIHCLPGWEGQSCQNQIDYCPGNQCQNGATCVPVFLNYTCTCPLDYTGFYCETSTTATTTTSTAPTSTASTTTTTTAPTTTTAIAPAITASTAPTTTASTAPTTTTSTAPTTTTSTAPTTTATTAPTTTASTAPTTTTSTAPTITTSTAPTTTTSTAPTITTSTAPTTTTSTAPTITTSTAPTITTTTAPTTTTSTSPTTTTTTAPTTTTTTAPTTTTSTAPTTTTTTAPTTTTTAPTTTNSTAPTTTTTIISQSSDSDGDESHVIGISGFFGLFFNIQVTGAEPSRKHSNASNTTTRVKHSG